MTEFRVRMACADEDAIRLSYLLDHLAEIVADKLELDITVSVEGVIV